MWDIGVVLAGALFALWGAWTMNLIIVILAVLSTGLLFHYGKQNPKEIIISIHPEGIQVDRLLYKYRTFESFWIFQDTPEDHELVLRSKKAYIPFVHIYLGDQDPEKVKTLLSQYLPLKEEGYPITHIISHLIGY